MTELLTAAQMRAIEAAAIASGQVTGLEFMERAGRGVVEAVFEEWPDLKAGSFRAVVLCGPGNNGGDGFVVARLLKEWGWEVEVFLYGDPERMPPDARVNHDRWVGMGEVGLLSDLLDTVSRNPGREVDLIVDGLFGIGLHSALPETVMALNCALFRAELTGRFVAIDLPCGLCADSGRPLAPPVALEGEWSLASGWTCEADLTVTFHGLKPGHLLHDGPGLCGKVAVVDIRLPKMGLSSGIRQTNPPMLPLAKRRDHKFCYGHALILSGGVGHGGAARMTARAALRVGAGLVTLAPPPAALMENASRLDAVMLKAVKDAKALEAILQDPRITALCLGPGLGLGEREAGLVATALRSRGEPRPTGAVGRGSPRLVLDADALTLIARDPALFALLHKDCVLTPHGGEFARLFPDIAAKLEAPATKGPAYSKVDATREAAARAGCVVLYKGPDTVIADPTGRSAINSAAYDRAAPWLATAGSGDVLAGFITGLLARGFSPFDAACTGAWLHVECARSFGPGLIAEDLPEELPKVFRALGL